MLKKVNNACPSLPFTHIKAMVNLDTTVLVCFMGLLRFLFHSGENIKHSEYVINNYDCTCCTMLSYDH